MQCLIRGKSRPCPGRTRYVSFVPVIHNQLKHISSGGYRSLTLPPVPPPKNLQVLTNADTPEQAETARKLGAQGIGLCRSEHMFFDPNRISAMRAMIVSEDKKERVQHLDTMKEFQRDDIEGMLK